MLGQGLAWHLLKLVGDVTAVGNVTNAGEGH